MRRASPPDMPAAAAQSRLEVEGSLLCAESANISMRTRPLACASVVTRNESERREANPPLKSLVPQHKPAARLKPTGTSCSADGTQIFTRIHCFGYYVLF